MKTTKTTKNIRMKKGFAAVPVLIALGIGLSAFAAFSFFGSGGVSYQAGNIKADKTFAYKTIEEIKQIALIQQLRKVEKKEAFGGDTSFPVVLNHFLQDANYNKDNGSYLLDPGLLKYAVDDISTTTFNEDGLADNIVDSATLVSGNVGGIAHKGIKYIYASGKTPGATPAEQSDQFAILIDVSGITIPAVKTEMANAICAKSKEVYGSTNVNCNYSETTPDVLVESQTLFNSTTVGDRIGIRFGETTKIQTISE